MAVVPDDDDILSVLPDKFARFLFEFHGHRFESLDLPLLPADRSRFDVHGALLDDKVLQYVILWTLICLHIIFNILFYIQAIIRFIPIMLFMKRGIPDVCFAQKFSHQPLIIYSPRYHDSEIIAIIAITVIIVNNSAIIVNNSA